MSVPILRLVESASPPLVGEALSRPFLDRLGLANPPSVRAWRLG